VSKLFAFELAGQEKDSRAHFPFQIRRLTNFNMISNVYEREISSALFLSQPTET